MKIKVLYFTAVWCGPCGRMKPTIAELQEQYKDTEVDIQRIDIDKDAENSQKYSITSIPTFIFLSDDKEVGTIRGFQLKKTLKDKIESLRNPS